MKVKFLLSLFVALGLLCSAIPADAAKVIKLHHLNKDDPFDNASGAMARVFKNLVEGGTNGQVTVQIFANSQLGKDNEVLQQVKSGIIQSGIHTVGGFASLYPLIGVMDIPFVFPDISSTYEVLDGPFGQMMGKDIEAKTGLKMLGFGDSGGFFQITNSKKPIKTPEDMKGLKIRVMPSETHKKVIESLGAQPAAINWAELYTALQTGVADGQINPVPIISFAKFNEVQKYLTLSDMIFASYVWVMNDKFWNSLSDHEKQVVQNAAKSAIVACRGVARAVEASDRGLPALVKGGMQVHALTPEEKAKFRDMSKPVMAKYIEDTYGADGKAMLDAFLKAVDETSAPKK